MEPLPLELTRKGTKEFLFLDRIQNRTHTQTGRYKILRAIRYGKIENDSASASPVGDNGCAVFVGREGLHFKNGAGDDSLFWSSIIEAEVRSLFAEGCYIRIDGLMSLEKIHAILKQRRTPNLPDTATALKSHLSRRGIKGNGQGVKGFSLSIIENALRTNIKILKKAR